MGSIFYYYYYLFYKLILKEDNPHVFANLALSTSEGLLLIGIVKIILAHYCILIGKWEMLFIVLVMVIKNHFLFGRMKAKLIVDKKPKILKSNFISFLITLLFFLGTTSWLFWGSKYVLFLTKDCYAADKYLFSF